MSIEDAKNVKYDSEVVRAVEDITPFLLDHPQIDSLHNVGDPAISMPHDAVEYLLKEGRSPSWKLLDPQPPEFRHPALTNDDLRRIAIDGKNCPLCQGEKDKLRKVFEGARTQIRVLLPVACDCKPHRAYFDYMHDISKVPLDYRDIRLSNIHKFQSRLRGFNKAHTTEDLLKLIEECPDYSYLLYGGGGSGKSTLLSALYEGAVARHVAHAVQLNNFAIPSVWRISATALAKQHHEYIMRDVKADERSGVDRTPTVTAFIVETAVKAGFQPAIFLEELDKFKTSEFQLKEFHETLNACQANGGQIVGATNLSPERWASNLGDQFGVPLTRRFRGKPHGVSVNFDAGTFIVSEDPERDRVKRHDGVRPADRYPTMYSKLVTMKTVDPEDADLMIQPPLTISVNNALARKALLEKEKAERPQENQPELAPTAMTEKLALGNGQAKPAASKPAASKPANTQPEAPDAGTPSPAPSTAVANKGMESLPQPPAPLSGGKRSAPQSPKAEVYFGGLKKQS